MSFSFIVFNVQQFRKISQEAQIIGVTKSRMERVYDKQQLREAIDELTVDQLEARALHYRVSQSQICSASRSACTKQELITLILQASGHSPASPTAKQVSVLQSPPLRMTSPTARLVSYPQQVPQDTTVPLAPPQQLAITLQLKARDGASEVSLVVRSDDDVHETVTHAFGLNGASVWFAERQLGLRGSLGMEHPGVRAGSFDDNGVPNGACLVVQEVTV